MSTAKKDFEHSVLVDRIATRFAGEFTPSEWATHKKEHPGADIKDHKIIQPGKGKDKIPSDYKGEIPNEYYGTKPKHHSDTKPKHHSDEPEETEDEKKERKQKESEKTKRTTKYKLDDLGIISHALSSKGARNPLKPLLRALHKKQDTKALINPALAFLAQEGDKLPAQGRRHYKELHDWLKGHVKGK